MHVKLSINEGKKLRYLEPISINTSNARFMGTISRLDWLSNLLPLFGRNENSAWGQFNWGTNLGPSPSCPLAIACCLGLQQLQPHPTSPTDILTNVDTGPIWWLPMARATWCLGKLVH